MSEANDGLSPTVEELEDIFAEEGELLPYKAFKGYLKETVRSRLGVLLPDGSQVSLSPTDSADTEQPKIDFSLTNVGVQFALRQVLPKDYPEQQQRIGVTSGVLTEAGLTELKQSSTGQSTKEITLTEHEEADFYTKLLEIVEDRENYKVSVSLSE